MILHHVNLSGTFSFIHHQMPFKKELVARVLEYIEIIPSSLRFVNKNIPLLMGIRLHGSVFTSPATLLFFRSSCKFLFAFFPYETKTQLIQKFHNYPVFRLDVCMASTPSQLRDYVCENFLLPSRFPC
jgi:hypothetical protein